MLSVVCRVLCCSRWGRVVCTKYVVNVVACYTWCMLCVVCVSGVSSRRFQYCLKVRGIPPWHRPCGLAFFAGVSVRMSVRRFAAQGTPQPRSGRERNIHSLLHCHTSTPTQSLTQDYPARREERKNCAHALRINTGASGPLFSQQGGRPLEKPRLTKVRCTSATAEPTSR